MNYIWHLCVIVSVYAILSVSLDILVGHLGLLVLCQSAFFAMGAYTYAILTVKIGIPVTLAIGCALCCAAAAAMLMAIVARRLRGDAVVLASFALLLFLGDILKNLPSITGGLDGLSGIPSPLHDVGGTKMIVLQGVLALLVAGICWAVVIAVTSGPYGRLFHGLRDDAYVATGIGIQPLNIYIRGFALAGGIAGIAGAIYAGYASYINPSVFGADVSILLMAMVLVGGAATRFGPLLGTCLLLGIPEVVRMAGSGMDTVGAINYIAMGCALTVFAVIRPRGLLGGYEFE